MKPGSRTCEPVARNAAPPASTVAVTWSMVAGIIWLAMARCHTSSYSRCWSASSWPRVASGPRAAAVGRIASCASCALRVLVV